MENNIKINKECIELRVNSKIYSNETIFAAGYIFLDRSYILLDKEKDKIVIYLYPRDKKADLRKLGFDFSNELLNYAHYFSKIKENAEVIKLITQRALFSAAPSLVEDSEDKGVEQLIKELEEEERNEKKSHRRKTKK